MPVLKNAWPYLAVVVLGAIVFALSGFTFRPADTQAPRHTVLVELFTSEGCSSCPPADELLARLQQQSVQGVQVVPLGFDVDYWNELGWKDRFSSADYSRRQQEYSEKLRTNGPYTPQMVVNGSTEFVGSSAGKAQTAITQAASHTEEAQIALSFEQDRLHVHVSGAEKDKAEVFLAITEDNLTTKVSGGENGGHTLHHSAVVRDFRKLGELKSGKFDGLSPVQLKPGWKRQDLRIVVFVQSPSTGKVLAVFSSRPAQS